MASIPNTGSERLIKLKKPLIDVTKSLKECLDSLEQHLIQSGWISPQMTGKKPAPKKL